MMFTIDNTPKKSSYLKKGLNKLRSSTRKSPGKSLKKSPAQTSAHRYQGNTPSENSRSGVGRADRLGSHKSSQVATKGQKPSPRTTSRTAKSPGLTASVRKVNGHLWSNPQGLYKAPLNNDCNYLVLITLNWKEIILILKDPTRFFTCHCPLSTLASHRLHKPYTFFPKSLYL